MKITVIIEDLPGRPFEPASRWQEQIPEYALEPDGYSTRRGVAAVNVSLERFARKIHAALYRDYLKELRDQAIGMVVGFAAQQGDTRVLEALEAMTEGNKDE